MNYDEYLSHEQYRHDEEIEPNKIWLVIIDSNFLVYSSSDVRHATSAYNAELTELESSKYELGWVYENDYDPTSFEYTYRLFNPT